MPISEDEFNQYSNDSTPSTTMSKAELRKTHKPIMEKRRRAKINNCLNEIKDLILVAMKKDPERHSKLEKADILEMAVKHLKNIQKQQKEIAIRTDPGVAQKYKSGYLECAAEVTSYINKVDGVEPGMRQRLATHLNKCATSLDYKPTAAFAFEQAFNNSSSSLLASLAQNRYAKLDDQNNNASAKIQGIELIPSCLPSGEFAFLVPKSSFQSILLGDDRPSAFVSVGSKQPATFKVSKPLSPPLSPPNTDWERGFQPVIPKSVNSSLSSSSSSSAEIRSIRFPINTTRKDEPLSIITNNAERHRHAQTLSETCHYEENAKRRRDDGLLTTVGSSEPPRKVIKLEVVEVAAASSSSSSSSSSAAAVAAGGKGDNEIGESSMWRPW